MFSRLVFFILDFSPLVSSGSLTQVRARGNSDVRLICPGTSSAIGSSAPSHGLRKFPHGPVNGQNGLRVRLLWFPLHGLTHYQPPPECYNELFAPTATKC